MTTAMTELAEAVDRDGCAVVPGLIDAEAADRLIAAVAGSVPGLDDGSLHRDGELYGRRNLFAIPEVRDLARSAAVRGVVGAILGDGARAVRGLWFDKTAGANWGVPWHQDTTVAVRDRSEVAGYGPWTLKAGLHHVRPPVAVLERMVTVRVHLDDCGADNGPLEVLPGSHRGGRLDAAQTVAWRAGTPIRTCLVPRGGAVVMRPLILHASSAAEVPGHRRVIHLEYAAGDLTPPLEWLDAVGEDVG